jgi:predicted ATPase
LHGGQGLAYGRTQVISEIRIRNFKSIEDLTLKLGRVTVLIGENGSGKSNILEAIGFAGCASADKLDNAVLASRGIRVCEPGWMAAAFPGDIEPDIRKSHRMFFKVSEPQGGPGLEFAVSPFVSAKNPYPMGWYLKPMWDESSKPSASDVERVLRDPAYLRKLVDLVVSSVSTVKPEDEGLMDKPDYDETRRLLLAAMSQAKLTRESIEIVGKELLSESAKQLGLSDFMIYAPENTLLRTPSPESAVLPLGSKGEGLFRHLESFAAPENEAELKDMKERLKIFGWFEDFLAPDAAAVAQARLQIRDRWLAPGRAVIDQRSANEGFLYLLFYFALMMSPRTPRFFAIDNLDNALNPKLCAELMRQIAELATGYDKQVICTTHNPAILDGLDLHDDAQRLYSVQRNEEGKTTVNRVRAPKPVTGQAPMKLSAAFLAGYIGGLPEHF